MNRPNAPEFQAISLNRAYGSASNLIIPDIKRPNAHIYSHFLTTGFLYQGNMQEFQKIDEGLEAGRPMKGRSVLRAYGSNALDATTDVFVEKFTNVSTVHEKLRSFSNGAPTTDTRSAIHDLYARALLGEGGIAALGDKQRNQIMDLLLSQIHAIDIMTERSIYTKIFDPHKKKVDGDTTTDRDGVLVDFATDTGRTAIAQVVDLADTAITTTTKAMTLASELHVAAIGTSGDFNIYNAHDAIYVIIPMSVGEQYFKVFESVKDAKTMRVGVSSSDGTFTSLLSFTAYGFIFICLEDSWFLTTGTSYRALILPRCSIKVSLPKAALYPENLNGKAGYEAPQIFKMKEASGNLMQVVPSIEGIKMWQDIDARGQDPILRRVAKGGIVSYPRDTMDAIFEALPSNHKIAPNGYSFEYIRYLGLIRMMPQYIQEWTIDPAKITFAAEASMKSRYTEQEWSRMKEEQKEINTKTKSTAPTKSSKIHPDIVNQ